MPNRSKPLNLSSGMHGPGVTLGMKKPRIAKIGAPKKFAAPKDMRLGALAKPTSYLPTLAGGGKVISCKQT